MDDVITQAKGLEAAKKSNRHIKGQEIVGMLHKTSQKKEEKNI